MATIIRDLPFGEARTYVEVGGRLIPILPFQPIVWVSIVSKEPGPFDHRTPRIPAVVDLGFNGTFAIREEQLREWAGIDPRVFPKLRQTRLRGATTEQRLANLWLHPNAPRSRDTTAPAVAWRLCHSSRQTESDRRLRPVPVVDLYHTAILEPVRNVESRRC